MMEGFEVNAISAYDADEDAEKGTASITWVEVTSDGRRRIHTEHFKVREDECRECARLFYYGIA